VVAAHYQQPGRRQTGEDDQLGDDPGPLGADTIDQHAVDHAQQRPGQDRDGDHEALLGRCQSQVLGHVHAQRAQQHPDHEAHIEVEEGRQQGWRVAGLEEILGDHL